MNVGGLVSAYRDVARWGVILVSESELDLRETGYHHKDSFRH